MCSSGIKNLLLEETQVNHQFPQQPISVQSPYSIAVLLRVPSSFTNTILDRTSSMIHAPTPEFLTHKTTCATEMLEKTTTK
jgi:hypothetical protein